MFVGVVALESEVSAVDFTLISSKRSRKPYVRAKSSSSKSKRTTSRLGPPWTSFRSGRFSKAMSVTQIVLNCVLYSTEKTRVVVEGKRAADCFFAQLRQVICSDLHTKNKVKHEKGKKELVVIRKVSVHRYCCFLPDMPSARHPCRKSRRPRS